MGYRSNVGVAFSKKGFISFFQNNEKKIQAQLATMLSIADEFRFNLDGVNKKKLKHLKKNYMI